MSFLIKLNGIQQIPVCCEQGTEKKTEKREAGRHSKRRSNHQHRQHEPARPGRQRLVLVNIMTS